MNDSDQNQLSNINIRVELNKDKIPVNMEWSADDNTDPGFKTCKAMLLSLWDKSDATTMKIDLWTNEMRIDEMNSFFYQTLYSLSETYFRATGNKPGAEDIMGFANAFGKKAQVIK
jgi:gliding motility-associated protein GldC